MSNEGTNAQAKAPEEGRRVRPSSLPALAQCPRFTPDPVGRDYTNRGTERHESLAEFLFAFLVAPDEAAQEKALSGMDDEEREAIKWAADYVNANAPLSDYPLEIEKRREFVGPDFERIKGTLDVRCGPVVFDFKWRFGDYWAQQAAYALTLMPPARAVTCHLLFGQPQKARKRIFTEAEAEALVFPIIEAATAPGAEPKACDFCGWCVRRLQCSALTDGVKAAMLGRGDWGLENWHVSEITDPAEMAKALRAARRLKSWAESCEYHAKQMAVIEGKTLPGFTVKTRSGGVAVADMPKAFAILGLPEADFLRACEVHLNPPKDKSRPGLVQLYATHSVLSEKRAKEELRRRLAPVLKTRPSVTYLEEHTPE